MRLFELKQERKQALDQADAILARKDNKEDLTPQESVAFEAHMKIVRGLTAQIEPIEAQNTLRGTSMGFGAGPVAASVAVSSPTAAVEDSRATAFRGQFAAWMNNTLTSLGGGPPAMEATAPTGVVSVGSGSGLDSIAVTISSEILPYLQSYFALDSFGQAGASIIATDHTRPMFQPVLSAGAADSVFAENTAPGTSQPFGISGFTFGGSKYSRLVLATYESLMNSELPLQQAILDELLAGLASTLTTATTTAMYAALTAASSTLSVGGGSGNDIYTSLIDLRHAVPPRFDLPGNKYMLSRATLATIRNKRASTSGVAMFDPTSDLILGRSYAINDNFDTVCGAGFIAYGSWANGCFLRRTPVVTRVLDELYAGNGQVGYRTMQFADAHFMAELAGAAQPPSYQPLFYTSIATES